MDYYDDILNVYAYLFSKEKNASERLQRISEEAEELRNAYRNTTNALDELKEDIDDKLEKAFALAAEMGIDVSDIKKEAPEEKKKVAESTKKAAEKLFFPPDFDFKKDFKRLVEEAHAAGFKNVNPEEVLSPEEIARAEEFCEKLDREFEAATGLKGEDVAVLCIAVALRICWHYFMLMINTEMAVMGGMVPEKITVDGTGKLLDSKRTGGGLLSEPEKGSIKPVDATEGVDLGELLGTYKDGVKAGKTIANHFFGTEVMKAKILDYNTILNQDVPFDVQETDMFDREDVIAYNRFLGWVMGAVNIMTDTVTTYEMKSYSVNRMAIGATKPLVDKKISTLWGVLLPVLKNGAYHKEAVVAAVLQEAIALDYGRASSENIRALFNRAVNMEKTTSLLAEKTGGVVRRFNFRFGNVIGDVAVIALVNTIISAIHSVLYDENECSMEEYAIRTNKIILYSGIIATSANSIPAFMTEDFSKLDFAGIVTTCISWFQSSRFWIDVKTDFLVNAHMAELKAEIDKINEFLTN